MDVCNCDKCVFFSAFCTIYDTSGEIIYIFSIVIKLYLGILVILLAQERIFLANFVNFAADQFIS